MKHYLTIFFGMMVALFATGALADDGEKLKALERAMTEPAAGVEITKKPRTRAIVFDAAPEDAAPAATGAKGNCSALPPDVAAVAIDFTIQFKMGSAQIAPSSEKVLREIAKILSLSDKCVIVEGHTDATGNADRNVLLSRERADSVVKFISEKAGLDTKRLVPIGKGSQEPLKNLDPRNGHNRRVVFKVVS